LSSRAAAQVDAITVTVQPTTNITDGQQVTITVRNTGDARLFQAEAHLCRGGVTYQPSDDARPNADFESDGPNCPGYAHPVSTSSDTSIIDSSGVADNAASPNGESFLFSVGSGVVNWTDPTATPRSLTCDETHSCDLVVEVQYRPPQDQTGHWRPVVFPIGYGTADPIAGCGGPAPGVLSSGGSDRMQDAWVGLTLADCGAHPGLHAPSRATFSGEGDAVTAFSSGALDFAYTAGGYDKDMATGSTPNSGLVAPGVAHRPSVAVPVALNATVLAVGGGRLVSSHKVPYRDIKMAVPEVAGLLGGGQAGATPYQQAILQRNPELNDSGLFDTAAQFGVGAYADAEASTWYATRWLNALAPDAWRVPDLNQFGAVRGHPRGVDADLATADPTYIGSLNLVSGRPVLRKGLAAATSTSQGGLWVLTDLDTAAATNLTMVQIPDSKGNFVAPTPDSLRSAVPGMKADDQGMLISDPKTAPAGAYPLTMVEYALAPAEPLVKADCTPRTDSQKLLTDWLAYVTGDGQSKLPAGMVALPDNLKQQAADAIKKVGASASTCAGGAGVQPPAIGGGGAPAGSVAPPLAIPPPESAASPAVGSPLPGVGSSDLPAGSGVGSDASALPSDATSSGAADHGPRQLAAAIPAFAGRRSAGWGSSAFALLGVIGLSSLALVVTAKTR
jgi:hypothetical protein